MDRKKFIQASLIGAATLASSPIEAVARQIKKRVDEIPLRISFQEGTAPGATLEERFDFMSRNGVTGFEPYGNGLPGRVAEIERLKKGSGINLSAVCAGFAGFILSEDAKVRAEFDYSIRDIIAAAGSLGAVGVIMVPAFNGQKPCMPHTADTRKYLVDELAKLGEYALTQGTTVILEPLNRGEAHFLRQVADAAAICRDTKSEGVRCMGDFWHMTPEESSDAGAFLSGGKYMNHVHIASRATRNTPGEDGAVDNYTDGFRALKQIAYPGYVSFECGCKGDRETVVTAALELLRTQWDRA